MSELLTSPIASKDQKFGYIQGSPGLGGFAPKVGTTSEEGSPRQMSWLDPTRRQARLMSKEEIRNMAQFVHRMEVGVGCLTEWLRCGEPVLAPGGTWMSGFCVCLQARGNRHAESNRLQPGGRVQPLDVAGIRWKGCQFIQKVGTSLNMFKPGTVPFDCLTVGDAGP